MRERLGLGTVALLLAGLVAIAPLLLGPSSLQLVGTLLIVAGVLEGLHSFRRVSQQARPAAYASAALTVLMGLLVLGAPLLVGTALTLLLAGSFLVDGFQRAGDLWRREQNDARVALVLAVLGNVAATALLLILWTTSVTWTAALAGALRIFGVGWNIVTTPIHTAEQAGSRPSALRCSVEPSAGRVRLLLWGVHGRLRWVDLEASPGWRPATSDPNDPVEIVLPLRAASSEG
jgi:uncharacterized membrane protein HdeD (DUF308 family)